MLSCPTKEAYKMKIYTGRGDQGHTSLFSGEEEYKDSHRVSAYGTLDELNAILGLAYTFCKNQRVKDIVISLQRKLFEVGADLATTNKKVHRVKRIGETDWRTLETLIDDLQPQIPKLDTFILPGGSPCGAFIHLARESDINPEILIYLNRLSDLLFVMARFENALGDEKEEIWQSQK